MVDCRFKDVCREYDEKRCDLKDFCALVSIKAQKKSHRSRAYRRKQYFKKQHRLSSIAEYSEVPGIYKKANHYLPHGRGSSSAYLKKLSNRRLRRGKEIYQNGDYKKVFDYWWELT